MLVRHETSEFPRDAYEHTWGHMMIFDTETKMKVRDRYFILQYERACENAGRGQFVTNRTAAHVLSLDFLAAVGSTAGHSNTRSHTANTTRAMRTAAPPPSTPSRPRRQHTAASNTAPSAALYSLGCVPAFPPRTYGYFRHNAISHPAFLA